LVASAGRDGGVRSGGVAGAGRSPVGAGGLPVGDGGAGGATRPVTLPAGRGLGSGGMEEAEVVGVDEVVAVLVDEGGRGGAGTLASA
jgi:hypothetical protein